MFVEHNAARTNDKSKLSLKCLWNIMLLGQIINEIILEMFVEHNAAQTNDE